jgi:hypothetical protein
VTRPMSSLSAVAVQLSGVTSSCTTAVSAHVTIRDRSALRGMFR